MNKEEPRKKSITDYIYICPHPTHIHNTYTYTHTRSQYLVSETSSNRKHHFDQSLLLSRGTITSNL